MQPPLQQHRHRAEEKALDSRRTSHRGANLRWIPQPNCPNLSQQRSLSRNCRIARAVEMVSTRSQVAIGELTGHAYLSFPPPTARPSQESRFPVWDCALMSGHRCFPKRGDRFESTRCQMDSDGSPGENPVIDVGTCPYAIAPVSANEESSHRDADL